MKKIFFVVTLWGLILAVTSVFAEVLLRVWLGVWNQARNLMVDPDVGAWNKSNYVACTPLAQVGHYRVIAYRGCFRVHRSD